MDRLAPRVYAAAVPRHVAILGAGPAGASLAAYLARHRARRGAAPEFEVTLFDGGTRPPIVVGESLVPAVVPFLQRLGIEEEVASYSTFKPGAIFRFGLEDVLMFRFDEVRGARTTYSYNVPRDRFDASVRDAALAAGARLVPQHARVERDGTGERVRLAEASLAAAGLARQPDFIVDAGGRSTPARAAARPPGRAGRSPRHRAARAPRRRDADQSGRHPHRPARARLVVADPAARPRVGRARDGFAGAARVRLRRRGAVRQLPAPRPAALRLGRHREAHLAGGEVHELSAAPHARRRAELGARGRRVRIHRSGVLERSPDRARRRLAPRAGADPRTAIARCAASSRATCASSRTGSVSCAISTTGACSRCSRSARR